MSRLTCSGSTTAARLVFMNVHVFAHTQPTHQNVVRDEATRLVHDATFADGWRDVPLLPLDPSLLSHTADDIAQLDDFVHFVYDGKSSTPLDPPIPGIAPSHSQPLSHSPLTPPQSQSRDHVQQGSVHHSTMLGLSASYTRHFDVPDPPSIYKMGDQLSVFPSPSLSRIQTNILDVASARVPLSSTSPRLTSGTPQSMPPNQQQLYAKSSSLRSAQSGSQDSLYGSHELHSSQSHPCTYLWPIYPQTVLTSCGRPSFFASCPTVVLG